LVSLWGKGGVGKSTLSVALGSYLASQGRRVLVLTTDPMPSLGFLKERVWGKSAYENRLEVLELGEEEVIEKWKERFGDEVYYVVSSLLPVGREIIDYVANAPGISDEFLLYLVYAKFTEDSYEYIVWDLPAASEAVRLLALESKVYAHMGDAFRLYLKVRGHLEKIVRHRRATPEDLIRDWQKLANDVLEMLRCENHIPLLVTIPEPLGVYQAVNLYKELLRYGIRPRLLVVNMFFSASSECTSCRGWISKARVHGQSLKALEEHFKDKIELHIVPCLPLGEEPESDRQLLLRHIEPIGLKVLGAPITRSA